MIRYGVAVFALSLLVLLFFAFIANALPDSTAPISTPSDDLSIGQVIGLTVSVGVAVAGLWLFFRKPKNKKQLISQI